MTKRKTPTCNVSLQGYVSAVPPGMDDPNDNLENLWGWVEVPGISGGNGGIVQDATTRFRVKFLPRAAKALRAQGSIQPGTWLDLSGSFRVFALRQGGAPELTIFVDAASVLDRRYEGDKSDRPDRVDTATAIPYAQEVTLKLG